MVIEKYQRVYRDEGDGHDGIQLSNNNYDMDGDVHLPGFKPRHINSDRIEKMLGMMELAFCQIEPDTPIYSYIEHGLRQLLAGQKSDWKITYIQIKPGRLRLSIRNKKFAKIMRQLESLDREIERSHHYEDLIVFDWQDNPGMIEIDNYITVDFEFTSPDPSKDISLELSHKRKDTKDTDLYRIYVRNDYASVREEHQINPTKREIELRFVDASPCQEDIADDKNRVLVGEITEYR